MCTTRISIMEKILIYTRCQILGTKWQTGFRRTFVMSHGYQNIETEDDFDGQITSVKSRMKLEQMRNEMFTAEKSRLLAMNAPRIEKIMVKYKGMHLQHDFDMLMNKNLSTPFNCANHISKIMGSESVIALVKHTKLEMSPAGIVPVPPKIDLTKGVPENTEKQISEEINLRQDYKVWDMHRPLEEDCELRLLKFNMNLVPQWFLEEVNAAYWRSCSMILGAVAMSAFDDHFHVSLANFPNVSVKSGAFCYDVELDSALSPESASNSWKIDDSVLISLTKAARRILTKNLNFERLEVNKEFALEMFQNDKNIIDRINSTNFHTASSNTKAVLYRVGSHIDVMDGPLIANTSLVYQYVISAIHQLRCNTSNKLLWRMQGLSLPKALQAHHAVWATLEHRSRNLVKENLPFPVDNIRSHKSYTPEHLYKSIENETKEFNQNTGQWLQDQWKSEDVKLRNFEKVNIE